MNFMKMHRVDGGSGTSTTVLDKVKDRKVRGQWVNAPNCEDFPYLIKVSNLDELQDVNPMESDTMTVKF